MTRYSLLSILFFLLLFRIPVEAGPIRISSQEEFDRLGERILAELPLKKDVRIQIDSGLYFFREDHLALSGLSFPYTTLTLSGKGAVLVGRDDPGSPPSFRNGFLDLDNMRHHDAFSPVKKAGFWPVPVLLRKGVYRIPVRDEPDVSEADAAGMKLVLSQWFVGAVYDVVKISRGYIYFRHVPYRTHMWSELRFGRCLPRYMLFSPEKTKSAYACDAASFLSVEEARIGSVVLDGLHFLGNGDGDRLLRFSGVEADSVVVRNCSFEGIRSRGILVERTDHFRLRNNLFRKGALNQVFVDKTSGDARIEDNRFIENGLQMTNDPVLACRGSEFVVRNNIFQDFTYSAIGVGLHYTDTSGLVTSGVVEQNEICMTESFRKEPMRALIDGGSIYVATQNKAVTIRRNYIHDLSGPHGNRGIFGDDGVVNLHVCDNTVLNIEGGLAIDVRRALKIGKRRNSAIRRTNTGNWVRGNTYNGRMRAYIREDDPDSYVGDNVYLDDET